MNVRKRTAPSSSSQHVRRQFANRLSKFFFTELDKGPASPYVLLTSGVLLSYCAWRVTERFMKPRHEVLAAMPPVQKVPLSASHNAFWGFQNVDPVTGRAPRRGEGSDSDVAAAIGSGAKYTVQQDDAAYEEAMRRPRLVHSEVSELRERPSAENPSGEMDLVCLELPEYDRSIRDDVYYRSVHYVPSEGGERAAQAAEVARKDGAAGADDYLSVMPGRGEGVIHGLAKCKAVTALNNCIPYAGSLESEVDRKLMLALAPVHVLRDPGKTLLPVRFTFAKQTPVETLVLGLHGGELPRWLSRSFPNFNVNVVEPDGALAGIARRFLGFQESSNLHLLVGSPVDYVRHVAADVTSESANARGASQPLAGGTRSTAKRFDLVLVDAVDGAGNLSPQYSQLETLANLRYAMSDSACVAVALPNTDAHQLYHAVQSWRMAFNGRTAVLVHCYSTPMSVLMTFQDNAARGKVNMGSVASVEEFQDLLRAHLRHYGTNRVQFDLTQEINANNFTILKPGATYDIADCVPKGHPELRRMAAAAAEAEGRGKAPGWNAWIRKAMGAYLSPAQQTDLARGGGHPRP